ncbi:MAG: uridine kinase, partial [Gammaproteobacteria bacterium]
MIIIGIAGATGGGKTTVAEELQQHFNVNGYKSIVIVSQDNYYLHAPHLGHKQNFEIPGAFDLDKLSKQLNKLHTGQSFTIPF